MNNHSERLTSGRLLARNTVWSLLGSGLPMVVAAGTIPMLIKGYGRERFGLLSIVWVVIGYFSFFDFGLGRALTQFVAKRLGVGQGQDIPDLVTTALWVVGLLGIGAATFVGLITPWLVSVVLRVPAAFRADGTHAFWVLALSLPFIIISGPLVGLMQAHQEFCAVSCTRMVTGSLTFLSPLIVLHWTSSLTAAASALAGARILAATAYALECRAIFPKLWREGRFQATLLRPLIHFGSWFTLDDVIGPFMIYVDRFVIGALLGLTAVAYYTTPYEVVTRLKVLPIALLSVLFPALTTGLAADKVRVTILFGRACRVVILVMFPLIALVILFAPEALSAWVGPAFAQHSSVVLRWLGIGVLINSVARLPHALIQGAGRPDVVAKLHCIELPLYILSLWLFLRTFGIEGAAVAWTLRIAVDTVALFLLTGWLFPQVRALSLRALGVILVIGIGMGLLTLSPSLAFRAVAGFILLACTLIVAYWEAHNMGWTFLQTNTEG